MTETCQWPISEDCEVEADALAIEHQAACRLADEYDAAQARGELSVQGQHKSHVPSENMRASNEDIGISRKTVFEARQIRDAEKAAPAVAAPIECLGVTLASLEAGMCRRIRRDGSYCGAPSAKSWCAGHAAIVFEPVTERQNRQLRRLAKVS